MEKYSRFEKREAHPMEKYIGRLVKLSDSGLKLMRHGCNELLAAGRIRNEFEVVGYSCEDSEGEGLLIIDASQSEGWSGRNLEPSDVVFKECEYYWYVSINDLIN
ncbi:hypothetical protein BV57P1_00018 [Phocaeicola phage BV57P1]|nr:hypothetical protein BV57P1_00018 [Phocaeicola phage BV57P1]